MISNHKQVELKLEEELFVQVQLIVFNQFRTKLFLVDHILMLVNKVEKLALKYQAEQYNQQVDSIKMLLLNSIIKTKETK